MDVRGKVLVMLNNDPDWDSDLFSGTTRQYYGRWTYKYEIAREMGAVGAIIVHTTPSAGYPWQVVQSSWTGEMFELPSESEGPYTSSTGLRKRRYAISGSLPGVTGIQMPSRHVPHPLHRSNSDCTDRWSCTTTCAGCRRQMSSVYCKVPTRN